MVSISNSVNWVADETIVKCSFNRYFTTKTISKILYHCFFYIFSDIKNKKWNSYEGHYNNDDFVSTKYFPVNDVHKSTNGKASFIGVDDVH